MKYRKEEIGSYNLHLVTTDKFKTIFFKFVFRDEIKKEEITIRNLLFDMLFFSTKNYPDKRKMNIKKQDLYQLSLFGNSRRVGTQIVSELCFSILNPKYTEKGMLEDSIKFMKEVILNPNVINNAFDEKSFNIRKQDLARDIISRNEYPKDYASLKLRENMDENNPFSYNSDGYLEDLEKITKESLYNYYKKMLNNSLIDIYVIGDIDFNVIKNLINENFNFKIFKKQKKEIPNNYTSSKRTPKIVKENSNFKQTQILIGLSIKNLTDIEKKYTMFLYNNILGNSPDSKLFKNVRESKSLVYDINSLYIKNDNIMVISLGTDINKYELALKSIKEEIKEITKGNFTEETLENSKELIISSLEEFEEYQSSIAEYYFALDYLNIDKVNIAIKNIESITKHDIIAVSKKVKIDTIYILKEQEHEGN